MSIQAHKSPSLLAVFLKGEAVSAFWNFLTKGIGLLNTFLTITSLTLYQYGVFQLLLSFAGISSDFLGLGSGVISNEMSRAVAEKRDTDAKRIFIEYTFVRLIIMLITWSIVFFGATYFFRNYDIDFVKDMRVISFIFISEGLFMIIRTLCLVKFEFSIIALRATLSKFIQSIILIYYFFQGNLGLKQMIWSIVIASSLSVIIILFKSIRVYLKWNNVKATEQILLWNVFVNLGSWEVLRQFINKITFRVKPWLIKLFISTEAVAIFSIAETIVTTFQDILPSSTIQSIVPSWVKDKDLSTKMFSYGVKYFFLTGLIIMVIAYIIVPPVIHTFFVKYNASLPLFYLMVINLPIFASGIIIGNYIIALRRQRYLFALHLFRSVATLLIILCTLPFIGLWGLAIEFVLIPILMIAAYYQYTKNENKGFHFDFDIIFDFKEEDKIIVKKALSIVGNWFRKFA
jgi:O-antigen/teichoic acid export membrane protein